MQNSESPADSSSDVDDGVYTLDADYLLYVEDNFTDYTLFNRAFRAEMPDFPLVHKPDGSIAKDFLLKQVETGTRLPCLAILDIKTPGMSGLDLLEFIRDRAYLCNIPVVMLTASSEESDITRAYASRCNAYLVKPSQYRRLKTVVATTVNFWIRLNRASV